MRKPNRRRFRSRRPRLMQTLEQRCMLASDFTLQILHASDLEGGVDAVQDAPNFAAVVDALEADAAGQSIESITLSAGDNMIPGRFLMRQGIDRFAPCFKHSTKISLAMRR